MKNTRHYLLAVCALALGFATPALHAEDAPPPSHKKEGGPKGDRDKVMKEKLGLTDAQVEQIKKIRADEHAQLEALRDKAGEPKEKRKEMKAIREASKAKIDAVLTPEQREKAEKLREEMKEHHEDKKAEKKTVE